MLANADRTLLLQTASHSLQHGLSFGQPLLVDPANYSVALQRHTATFVSLHRQQNLRGCIGCLVPYQTMICDVAHNAHAAAFKDPRFAPMTTGELADLKIEVSILDTPQHLQVDSEADLLSQLQPYTDGLILESEGHHATFLPVVWDSLETPDEFLKHLKQKAGLASDYWSDSLRFQRYGVESFEGSYFDHYASKSECCSLSEK